MALTDLQMAAALCEQVYRRSNFEQQLGNTTGVTEGFDGSSVSVNPLVGVSGTPFTLDNGFYYNNSTGFVAQIVQANGKIFLVLRGSDLSSDFYDAIIPALLGDPLGGRQTSSTVDEQDWANNKALGLGTVSQTQFDDALLLLQLLKSSNHQNLDILGITVTLHL